MNVKSTKYLRYHEDVRSIAFVFITVLLLLMPFFIELPLWGAMMWICVSSMFCFISCVINHNHVHLPMFRLKVHNQLLSILLSIAKGHTSTGVIVAHNLNHHQYNGGKDDWIRTSLAGSGPGLVRVLRYVIKASVSMAKGRADKMAPQLDAKERNSLRIERFSLFVFSCVIVLLDPYKMIVFVVMPWAIGMLFLIGVNLMQHDGCDPASKYNHSRNFTNKVGNWLLFNNGFHTVHHLHPGAHWSGLPALHADIEGKINKKLNYYSILYFFMMGYIFSM